MKFVLLICLIVILVSCDSTDSTDSTDFTNSTISTDYSEYTETYEMTDIKVTQGVTVDKASGEPITGKVLEKYANGSLRTETIFKEGKRIAIRLFSGKGSLAEVLHYKDEVLERVEYSWSDDGQVLGEKVYLSDGQHYARNKYYENGQLHTQNHSHLDGYIDGMSRTWDEKGRLVSEECIKRGQSVDKIHCP
jgi:antitoxin component YwqK of YwqJK toxin-antitoxin module